MLRYKLFFCLLFLLSLNFTVGCGGSTPNTVIENAPPVMTVDEAEDYSKAEQERQAELSAEAGS